MVAAVTEGAGLCYMGAAALVSCSAARLEGLPYGRVLLPLFATYLAVALLFA